MTEITRVPLQPIAKGSLSKLWLGIAALALVGGGIAYGALPPSVSVETVRGGAGALVKAEDVPIVNYVGKLKDGKVFDQGEQVPMPLAQMIPGFRDGLTQMRSGGKYKLSIPSEKAYGAKDTKNPMTGEVVIPANSDLVFDVEVLQVVSRADYERYERMRQIMQMQQAQQAQPGAAPGAAHP